MHKQQEQHQTALGYQAVSSDKDDNTSATVDEVAMDSIITLSSPSERRDDNDLLEIRPQQEQQQHPIPFRKITILYRPLLN